VTPVISFSFHRVKLHGHGLGKRDLVICLIFLFSWVGLSDFSWPKKWRNKPGFSDKTVINIRISHFSLYGNRITVLIGLMYHRFSGVCHIDATSYRFSAAWFGSDTHFVGKWVGWDVISWPMSIIVCCDTQEAQLSQRNRATRYVSWNFITL